MFFFRDLETTGFTTNCQPRHPKNSLHLIMNSKFYNFYYSVFDVDFIISNHLSSGSWTRTSDLMVMSHTSCLLLYPAIFLDKDMKTFLIYQIFFNFFVVCKGFEPLSLHYRLVLVNEVSCLLWCLGS